MPNVPARVKIYTRSMNPTLHARAMQFIDLPYPKVRLTDTTADGYLYQVIADTEADYVINIDEDAFVTDSARLQALLEHVIEHGDANVGMPDGGIVKMRRFNPLVTNPFFTIMNTSKLRGTFTPESIEAFDPTDPRFFEGFPRQMLKTEWDLHPSYEPFYKFYVWLSQNFPTLYLDAREHSDGETTELLDHEGQPFLLHTWYSRWYGKDFEHTDRINAVIAEASRRSGLGRPINRAEFAQLRATAVEYKVARRVFLALKRRYGL